MNLQPLFDKVIIKPLEKEKTTSGGIIIPDSATEKPQSGKILAVGAGKDNTPLTVKVGDVVIYGKYSGTEIEVSGDSLIIMQESDILAIID